MFFISDAMAADSAAQSGTTSLILLGVMFVAFYFLLIRPQQKRAKQHKQMLGSLSKGDELITSGGLLGKATKVGDNFVSVEVGDSTVVTVQKQQIIQVMPKGTIKSAN